MVWWVIAIEMIVFAALFTTVFVKYEVQQKAAKNPTPVSAAYV